MSKLARSLCGIAAVLLTGCGGQAFYKSTIVPVELPPADIGVVGLRASSPILVPAGIATSRELLATIYMPYVMVVNYTAICDGTEQHGSVGMPWETFYAQELTQRQTQWDQELARQQKRAEETKVGAKSEVRVKAGPISGSVNLEGTLTAQPSMPPRPVALPPDVVGPTVHEVKLVLGTGPMTACTFEVATDNPEMLPALSGRAFVRAFVDQLPNKAGMALTFRTSVVARLEAQGARRPLPPPPKPVAPPRVVVVAPPRVVVTTPPRVVVTTPPHAPVVTVPPARVEVAVELDGAVSRARPPAPDPKYLAEQARIHAARTWHRQSVGFVISLGADPTYQFRLKRLRLEHEAEVKRLRLTGEAEAERLRLALKADIDRAGLAFRVSLRAHLASSGARIRPARPAQLAEDRPVPPSEHSQWSSGSWVFNNAVWQWQWSPGHWVTSVGHQVHQTVEVAVEVINEGPRQPPPLRETQPPPPAAGAVWVQGAWVWSSGQWSWRAGYWTRAAGGVHVQVPGVHVDVQVGAPR